MMKIIAAVASLAMLAGSAFADGNKLVVIVAKTSKLANMSKRDLQRLYLGEPVYDDDDTALVPFNASPNTPERTGFDRHVLGMSPDQVGRHWVDRKVRGESGAPRSLPSPAHVAKVVAKFPHAIGYISVDHLTSDVRVLTIDGVPYTDSRYTIATD